MLGLFVLSIAMVGCNFPDNSIKNDAASGVEMNGQKHTPVQPPPKAKETIAAQPSSTPLMFVPTATFLPTSTSVPTQTPAAQAFQEPEGCLRPPDDYSLVTIGNATLNARTDWMLQRAQELYGGTIPITTSGITQGSYNAGGVAASFGTHDGGGAVDLTVRNIPIDYSIKWEDIPALIDALRLAGFAAWYRDERENLTPHIHAIAIGDRDLSPAAAAQLDGYYGYFRGYDGFPRDNQVPLAPRYGSVIICQWMLDMGYRDMRGQPLSPPPQ
jgi:hypothetical protein